MTRDAEPLSQGRFRGRATQSRDSERFTIGHWFANNPDGSTHPHSHEAAHFLWITSGRFESETATPNRSLPPIIYTPADIVHSDRFIGNGSFFSVSVANDTLWEIKDFRPPDRALQPHSWRARWILRERLGRDLDAEIQHWVYVGDSTNDAAMFARFPHSVGVANIARFWHQLAHHPRYVAPRERGQGFADVAEAVLSARGQA